MKGRLASFPGILHLHSPRRQKQRGFCFFSFCFLFFSGRLCQTFDTATLSSSPLKSRQGLNWVNTALPPSPHVQDKARSLLCQTPKTSCQTATDAGTHLHMYGIKRREVLSSLEKKALKLFPGQSRPVSWMVIRGAEKWVTRANCRPKEKERKKKRRKRGLPLFVRLDVTRRGGGKKEGACFWPFFSFPLKKVVPMLLSTFRAASCFCVCLSSLDPGAGKIAFYRKW